MEDIKDYQELQSFFSRSDIPQHVEHQAGTNAIWAMDDYNAAISLQREAVKKTAILTVLQIIGAFAILMFILYTSLYIPNHVVATLTTICILWMFGVLIWCARRCGHDIPNKFESDSHVGDYRNNQLIPSARWLLSILPKDNSEYSWGEICAMALEKHETLSRKKIRDYISETVVSHDKLERDATALFRSIRALNVYKIRSTS